MSLQFGYAIGHPLRPTQWVAIAKPAPAPVFLTPKVTTRYYPHSMPSTSRRPYLIRAIYEWAIDNGYTPHLLVSADAPGVIVPREYVQEGRITLNISPMATQGLNLDIEPIWFSARFSGRAHDVYVPSGAVLAIFARENGEGVMFGEVEPTEPSPPSDPQPQAETKPRSDRRPQLRVVK